MVWTVDSRTEFLATWNVLCIDGPALVTSNIAVELGIANGSKVIIKQVVPHPEDHQGWNEIHKQIVKLSRPPICVFAELSGTDHSIGEYLPGQPGWFPVMCIKEWMTAPKDFQAGKNKTFYRTQIPLTPAFSMSDYKVQGRGFNMKFIIDLCRPPDRRLALQNIYVMLSRMTKWEDLAILRPFDDNIFRTGCDENWNRYDEFLENENKATKTWYESKRFTFFQNPLTTYAS